MKGMKKGIILCSALLVSAMIFGGCGSKTEAALAEAESAPASETEKEPEKETETEIETESETPAWGTTEPEETETASEDTQQPAADSTQEMSSIRVYGSVQEMNDGQISIQNDNPHDMYGQIILNVTEETQILDAVNAETRTIADIEAGEVLYAYVSPVMTRSMPPISNAELILCDIPADFGAPEYAEVDEIIAEADGRIGLWTNRDIIYWTDPNMEILDFVSREKIDVASIKEGSKVLAWYRIALQSLPAQTTPDKIIVF